MTSYIAIDSIRTVVITSASKLCWKCLRESIMFFYIFEYNTVGELHGSSRCTASFGVTIPDEFFASTVLPDRPLPALPRLGAQFFPI